MIAPRNAAKIRSGISIGRQIAASIQSEGLSERTQAFYGHPALRDPLTEQAKYRTLVHLLARSA